MRALVLLVALSACSKLIDLRDVTARDAGGAAAMHCGNGQHDGDETDVDCGGSCGPCGAGLACHGMADCTSGVCQGDRCIAASCTDQVKNGDETDRDCGGACGACGDGLACHGMTDCRSGVCSDSVCRAATCTDQVKNGTETDVDCGGGCLPCATGELCRLDSDCAAFGTCTMRCQLAKSCVEILLHHPTALTGAYTIAPAGLPFGAVCDMTRDGGGWTLLLKSNGDPTFGFPAPAWTDGSFLNESDLTLLPGNAKYPSFVFLPISTLRGELDGFLFAMPVPNLTAAQLFAGPPVLVAGYPLFNTGAPNWSTQPNCQTFGLNTPYSYAQTRFGWTANQEPDCLTNDTAIGFGLIDNGSSPHGAGYICGSTECSAGNVNTGGNGLLWGR